MLGLFPLALFALLVHVTLGIVVINRVHGLGIPHRRQKIIDLVWCLWQGGGLAVALVVLLRDRATYPRWLAVGGSSYLGRAGMVASPPTCDSRLLARRSIAGRLPSVDRPRITHRGFRYATP
jgi:hypothetical protein